MKKKDIIKNLSKKKKIVQKRKLVDLKNLFLPINQDAEIASKGLKDVIERAEAQIKSCRQASYLVKQISQSARKELLKPVAKLKEHQK